MSIVIHGPQGIGKPLAAPLLQRFFGLDVSWQVGSPPADIETNLRTARILAHVDDTDLYSWIKRRPSDFKAARILFITDDAPPPELEHARRIVHFDQAMATAVAHGVRMYLADWPRAQSIEAITARSILDAVGVPERLQTVPLFKQVNAEMSRLGWIRVRLRRAGEPVTWAYRPPVFKEAA